MAKVLDLPDVLPCSRSDYRILAQQWEMCTKSLDHYIRNKKHAVLLRLFGPNVQEIFGTIVNTGKNYKTAFEN